MRGRRSEVRELGAAPGAQADTSLPPLLARPRGRFWHDDLSAFPAPADGV